MDKKGPYQQIEFLKEDINQFTIDDIDDDLYTPAGDGLRRQPNGPSGYDNGDDDDDDDYEHDQNYQSSSRGSSPPRDFNIHADLQYMPIHDDYDSPSPIDLHKTTSTSSMSLESEKGLASEPMTLTKARQAVRCPECEKPMRTFYCANCIKKGKFVTLGLFVAPESQRSPGDCMLSNEQQQQQDEMHLPLESENNLDQMERVDETKLLQDSLEMKISALKKRTETLKELYDARKLQLEQTKKLIEEAKTQLVVERKSNRAKEGKIELIKRYIASRKASVKKRRDKEAELIDELKQHVYRRAFQLTNEVFPIEEINLLEQNSSYVNNMETSPLLTFSDGSHNQIEQQTAYSIVEPWLPSNGDYSAYSLWVNVNQDHINAPVDDSSERNPAYRIGAGLAFASQLIRNLATFLDVILPAKLDLRTFNRELLSETQFSFNVAKLNANIIHLCVTQGVDVSLLSSQKTLKNLMHLFNVNISDLGRKPIMELDNEEEAAGRIEEQLSADLSLVHDDFYDFSKFVDDDDVSDSEWEISESVNPVEMQLASEQSIHLQSGGSHASSGTTSYITRLPMRLFASFWSGGNT